MLIFLKPYREKDHAIIRKIDDTTCALEQRQTHWPEASIATATHLDPLSFGTHSIRRTKATLIYRKTGNLRAVQLLLGHTKVESTVRYLGVEVDDALAIAEQIDV